MLLHGRWMVSSVVTIDNAAPTPTTGPTPTAVPEATAETVASRTGTIQSVTNVLLPSVARIEAGPSTGTGFVVGSDESGSYILTNDHVVQGIGVGALKATLASGTALTVIGLQEDAVDDLAVLQVKELGLPRVTWASPTDESLAEPVVAIGYAEGFAGTPSVTSGIVSALARQLGSGPSHSYLQHTAPINHGNSGGPLADLQGRILGVNSYGLQDTQGLFFAVPASRAAWVAQRLIDQCPGVHGNAIDDPVATVRRFYAALGAHNTSAAYGYFTLHLQAALSEDSWARSVASEDSVSLTDAHILKEGAQQTSVAVALDTTWVNAHGAIVDHKFAGTCVLLHGDRGWRIDHFTLNPR